MFTILERIFCKKIATLARLRPEYMRNVFLLDKLERRVGIAGKVRKMERC